jgi:hypothetical protein
MALFARYYDNKVLIETSMEEIGNLIKDEANKETIANAIFHRYYDRYLKIFYFRTDKTNSYTKTKNNVTQTVFRNEFDEEYKSGFSIMTNCCLLIETIATFFEGQNETKKSGKDTFKLVFQKAATYSNSLSCFENEDFYKNIRCGLLHQGETYGKFLIRRDTPTLFDPTSKTINAKIFCDNLKLFLSSYKKELSNEKWDSDIWDKCRVKLRHIINNSQ